MRRKRKHVLWPAYFEANKSRSQGRRVPKPLALRGVKSEEIYRVAAELGLNPEINGDAAYPKQPWEKVGFVLIDKRENKTDLLQEIARKIRTNRSSG
ncbi:MAG: signal recognition particle subunit SRP19/SEC65 family protein [Candidatus Bathyarchaeota archaeon]